MCLYSVFYQQRGLSLVTGGVAIVYYPHVDRYGRNRLWAYSFALRQARQVFPVPANHTVYLRSHPRDG